MPISYYRERARRVLEGRWGNAILVSFIAGLFGGLIASSSSGSISIDDKTSQQIKQMIPDHIFPIVMTSLWILLLWGLVIIAISGMIQLGYCRYLLNNEDYQYGQLNDLFSQKHRFTDGLIMSLLRSLFITLWSMLCGIPGIIARYAYAMTPFILLENPNVRPIDAIKQSKELMQGHKMDLFLLDLSFIGWNLLCILTLGIGYLWLIPYKNASYAAFYRSLCPRMGYRPVD